MPRKRPRPDAEIEQLAAVLAARYSPALGIEPWLRRNVGRLTRLVRQEAWSWDDIGRAMTRAGIVYDTETGWNGLLLAMKASQARIQVRKARQDERSRGQAEATVPAPSQPQPVAKPSPIPTASGPQRFALAELNYQVEPPPQVQTRPPEKEIASTPNPAPKQDVDVDATLRRLFGEDADNNEEKI